MSLKTELSKFITDISDEDPEWRIFLEDFKVELSINSKVYAFTEYLKEVYRFRTDHFLREHNIPADMLWLVVWINNLKSQLSLDGQDYLIIPNYNYVKELRSKYNLAKR